MTNPNFGIALQPNSFQQSFGMGVQLGRQAKESQRQNALSAYVANPDDPENFNALAKAAPRIAMQERERQSERERQQKFVELRRRALGGDHQAQVELATIDNQAYNRMTEQQRAEVDAQDDALAQAAFQILQAPPDQRSAIWDEQARNLGADQYIGQYSDAMLNTIVNRAGIQERLQRFMQPDYMAIPEGGTLVNVRDPNAISQFGETQAVGPQGGPPPENSNPEAGATIATSDQVARVREAFGGDEQKAQQYMARNNIVEAKEVNGQTYYRVNGQWFDNPEGR